MATNQYFRKFQIRSEQNLVDDLLQEVIQIHGLDFVYLPKSKQKQDLIYGEDLLLKFDDYYDLEGYYSNYEGYTGPKDLIGKFGLEVQDQAVILLSRTRFDQATNYELPFPQEGDLIYDSTTSSLWEITYCSNDVERWFELGDLPIYKLNVSKYVYSNEKLDTGLEDIDRIEEDNSYQLNLHVNSGLGAYQEHEIIYQGPALNLATAKAEVINWDVPPNTIRIINIVGEFNILNGPIVGSTSGTSRTLTTNPDLLEELLPYNTSDNDNLQTEADGYLDHSEPDIFGFLKDN